MNAPVSSSTTEPSYHDHADGFSATLYAELQRIARGQMRQEASDHTLTATAVVNEAFLRLRKDGQAPTMERGHFVRLAARVMRNVLVDHARAAHRKSAAATSPSRALITRHTPFIRAAPDNCSRTRTVTKRLSPTS